MDDNSILAFTIQRMISDRDVSSVTVSSIEKEKLINKYKFEPDNFIWLTSSEDDPESQSINDLPGLTKKLNEFINNTEMSILLIDSLELLINENGLKHCVKFLKGLKSSLKNKNSINKKNK